MLKSEKVSYETLDLLEFNQTKALIELQLDEGVMPYQLIW